MSDNIVKVGNFSFRCTVDGTIEQWNHMRRTWGTPFKNADLDAVRAAFAAGAYAEENPELEPAPVLSEDEAEALAEAEALKAKLEAAREALKVAKEKAAKAKAARLGRATGTGKVGEREYRDPVKLALLAALAIPEGEESVTVPYGDLVDAIPAANKLHPKTGLDLTPYEVAKLLQVQLGQMTSVALAGTKTLNLTFDEAGVTRYSEMSEAQQAELKFWSDLLRAEKARSPKKSKLENVGTVTDEESDDSEGEDDENDDEVDEAA